MDSNTIGTNEASFDSSSTKVSEIISERIKKANAKFFSNDNISEFLENGELDRLVDEVSEKMEEVLKSLVIDTQNDHNTSGTARRVAKMFIQETFAGRYQPAPKITLFPNVTEYSQIYVSGPITIRSTCAHHLQNIVGKCYVGIYPGVKVIGLSKVNRIVDWVASRPQIQEEMTVQIAKQLEKDTEADGIAVLVSAEHHCVTHRGVKEHESDMTTVTMTGVFKTDQSTKQEFYNLINRMK